MAGPSLTIREARPGEAETLLAIQRGACVAAFAHIFPPDRYPFPDGNVLELWRDALADKQIDAYVAEVNGEPIGSVSVNDEWLRTLYVLPSHWSRGIGSDLHDHALARIRERGATRARLWTLEENWPARRFYEKRGWQLTEETRVVPFPPNPIDVQYAKEL
jgi:GNAT superfamily N-acetyltransferase